MRFTDAVFIGSTVALILALRLSESHMTETEMLVAYAPLWLAIVGASCWWAKKAGRTG